MPLYQIREINPHLYLGFWEITESPEELSILLKNLMPDNQGVLPIFSSEVRLRQWLASRVLAYTLGQNFRPDPVLLQTLPSGKPEFAGSNLQVSISHCRNLAAVILSDKYEVGIDIEFISPKVMRVRNKFLSESEETDAGEDIEKNLIYWSGKETLYKVYNKKQLIFKDHLFLKPFNKAQAGSIEVQIIIPELTRTFQLQYEILNQYILTYLAAV